MTTPTEVILKYALAQLSEKLGNKAPIKCEMPTEEEKKVLADSFQAQYERDKPMRDMVELAMSKLSEKEIAALEWHYSREFY